LVEVIIGSDSNEGIIAFDYTDTYNEGQRGSYFQLSLKKYIAVEYA
jgi:hypothetical protein